MQSKRSARRPRGSGSIIVKSGAYYGKWWVGQSQVQRKLGPIRSPSSRDGLTGPMAEARLRQLMAEVKAPPVGERVTIEEAGRRYLAHLLRPGRGGHKAGGTVPTRRAPPLVGPRRDRSTPGRARSCRRENRRLS
jgi:hypothetical protein